MIAMKKWQFMLLLLTAPVNAQTDDTGCSFCADGSDPAGGFEDVVVFTNEDGSETTCAELAFSLPFIPVDETLPETCSFIQLATFTSCGCAAPSEGTGSCSFCADGSDPAGGFEDVVVFTNEDGSDTTCANFAAIVSFLPDDPEVCAGSQLATSFSCGCAAPPDGPGTCSFCADGSELPEGFEDVVISVDEDGSETTCAMLAFSLPFIPVDETLPETCSFIQLATFTSCGCAAPPDGPGSCSFCADGSDPAGGFEDVLVTVDDYGTEITCAQFAAGTSFLPEDEIEDCAGVQFLATTSCGCPAPTGGCTLCADGSAVPDESLQLFPGATCGDLSIQANFIDADECSAFQVTAGIYCGCDSTVENICRVCNGTQLLPEVDRPIIFEGEEEVCGYAEFMANTMPEMCSSMQETYGPQCCFTEVSANSTTTIPSNTTSKAPTKMPSKAPTSTTATGVTTPTPSPSSGANMVKVELPIFVVIIAAFFSF